MSLLAHLFGGPSEGETRELDAPQPLSGYYESAATHEYYDGQQWAPAVVETLGAENARYVVPAMRCYDESEE